MEFRRYNQSSLSCDDVFESQYPLLSILAVSAAMRASCEINLTIITRTVVPAGQLSFEHVAIGARGLGFDSRASQIGHRVDNGLAQRRRFFQAALLRR